MIQAIAGLAGGTIFLVWMSDRQGKNLWRHTPWLSEEESIDGQWSAASSDGPVERIGLHRLGLEQGLTLINLLHIPHFLPILSCQRYGKFWIVKYYWFVACLYLLSSRWMNFVCRFLPNIFGLLNIEILCTFILLMYKWPVFRTERTQGPGMSAVHASYTPLITLSWLCPC